MSYQIKQIPTTATGTAAADLMEIQRASDNKSCQATRDNILNALAGEIVRLQGNGGSVTISAAGAITTQTAAAQSTTIQNSTGLASIVLTDAGTLTITQPSNRAFTLTSGGGSSIAVSTNGTVTISGQSSSSFQFTSGGNAVLLMASTFYVGTSSDPWGASGAFEFLSPQSSASEEFVFLAGKSSTHKPVFLVAMTDTAVRIGTTWATASNEDLIIHATNSSGTAQPKMTFNSSTGVVTMTAGSWVQNTSGEAALASPFTDATGTLTSTNLSFTVKAGRLYRIEGILQISNSTAAEGAQFDFNGGGATATTFFVAFNAVGSDVVGTVVSTTLAGVLNYSTVTGTNYVFVRGFLKVNAAGTFILRAAENTHATGTFTLGAGSWLALYDTVGL